MSNIFVNPAEREWASVAADATRTWLERAVIGLNLCPFAKAVHVKGQIHYVVAMSEDRSEWLALVAHELQALQQMDPAIRDTTLLIFPAAMPDFLEFSHFLPDADRVLRKLGLEGELQIASFHPRFQFAGTDRDDITNFTNRAPYPTLHLLREVSIAKALAAFPDAESIFEKNRQTLEQLGHAGWRDLGLLDDATVNCGKPSP